jgi:hypothetical protein
MKFKILLLTAALTLVGTVCALAQSSSDDPKPQTVAEAAKEKTTDKKAKKVFTNDDIPSSPEASAAPAAKDASSADADKNSNSSDDKTAEDKKKPEEESVEVKGAKKVVEAKSIQIDSVTEEMHKLEFDLANADTPEKASQIAQSIRNLQHNIEVWKNVRDDAQKVIDASKKPKDAKPGQ